MVTQEFGRYQYGERPYTGVTDDPGTLSPSKSLNTVRHLGSDGNVSALASTSSPYTPMQQFDTRNSNPLVPVRRTVVGPGGAQAMHQQNGSGTAVETPRNVDSSDVASTSSRSDRGAAAGLDIHSLAQEVAAVLRSTSGNASPPNMKEGQSRLVITNDDSSQVRLASTSGEGDHNERATLPRDNMTTESPPPHYTIAGGGQRNW
jgi:hypothetical protein